MATGVIPAKFQAASVRYTITIFLGSFLLFLVQPMVARMALPRLGGAPGVWNSAMLVYQTLLLAGYAYAHWLGSLSPRRQAVIQLVLLAVAAVTLPIGLSEAAPPPNANPVVWVPWLLLSSVGPLFFVVSAQAPLIQRWAAAVGVKDPYPLYAASNLGSFTGLLCYPLLVEPLLPVSQQRMLWTTGYLVLGVAVAWCSRGLPRGRGSRDSTRAPAARTLVRWALIAAVPSGLILSTTLHLTTDLLAMPLLWVVPLGIYLLSFSFAFQPTGTAARVTIALAPFLIVIAAATLFASPFTHLASAALSLLMLFSVSVALHHQLYEERPRAEQLTWFYLALATGGAIGGFFCAIVAPLAFNWMFEHPILIIAAAALITVPSPFRRFVDLWTGDRNAELVTIGGMAAVPAIVALGLVFNPAVAALTLLALALIAIGNRALFPACVTGLLLTTGGWQSIAPGTGINHHFRSFFGIYTITDAPGEREIAHGTTLHGLQNLGSEQRERMTTSYYAPRSGVGLALRTSNQILGGARRIDVVGLGAGTLACYARPGQAWTFYEIDPLVIRIARDPTKFTFLKRCLPNVPIVVGDARLSLAKAQPAGADILIIDAFSSDSIPMHLLTKEAFDVYRRRLRPDGLLLVHISNRFLDLEPVLSAEAAQGGWAAAVRWYHPTPGELSLNYAPSEWVALSPSRLTIDRLRLASGDSWASLPKQRLHEWTDDHASLLPIIRW